MTSIPANRSDDGGTGTLVVAEGKRRDLLELSIAYALILLAVWTPQPWQRLFYWAALTWVILTTGFSFEGWSATGLRISGLRRSLWVVGLALMMAAVAIGVASRVHTLHLPGYPPCSSSDTGPMRFGPFCRSFY